MKFTSRHILMTLAVSVAAAPIENEKRQLGGSDLLPSLSLPSSGLSTGLPSSGSTTTTGLGSLISGLGSSSSSIPSLGSSGSTGSTGLGSLTGSSSDLGTRSGSSSSSLTPSTTLKEKRQSDLESLTESLDGLTGSTSTGSTEATSSGTATTSSDGSCKSVTLLFARGTSETGTMGTIIGPGLATALENSLGADKVSSQGVDYPADIAGNAELGGAGGPAMKSQADSILSSCPDTKLVLSGYSQGAMVVHNALSSQGLDGSKVAASVLFGDPFNGQALEGVDASKVKEFCGGSDTLCSSGGGTTGTGSHLSYGEDADAAAKFIVSAIGV